MEAEGTIGGTSAHTCVSRNTAIPHTLPLAGKCPVIVSQAFNEGLWLAFQFLFAWVGAHSKLLSPRFLEVASPRVDQAKSLSKETPIEISLQLDQTLMDGNEKPLTFSDLNRGCVSQLHSFLLVCLQVVSLFSTVTTKQLAKADVTKI